MKYLMVPIGPTKELKADCWLVANQDYKFVGKGNFCGWYSVECIENADVVACVDDDGETPILLSTTQHWDSHLVFSGMCSKVIDADTIEEAFQKFQEFVEEQKTLPYWKS